MQDQLKNIKLIFLPANTTSLIQPMDQGVIQNWKCHYKSDLNKRIVRSLEADPTLTALESAKTFTLLNAIHMAHDAWEKVKPQTITNCFRKGGFILNVRGNPDERQEDVIEVDQNIDPVIEDLDPLHDVEMPDNIPREEFLEMVAMDADLEVFGDLSNADLLQAARGHEDEDEDDEPKEVPQTIAEKFKMMEMLRRFVEENALKNPTFQEIEQEVLRQMAECKKQKKISDFFK